MGKKMFTKIYLYFTACLKHLKLAVLRCIIVHHLKDCKVMLSSQATRRRGVPTARPTTYMADTSHELRFRMFLIQRLSSPVFRKNRVSLYDNQIKAT